MRDAEVGVCTWDGCSGQCRKWGMCEGCSGQKYVGTSVQNGQDWSWSTELVWHALGRHACNHACSMAVPASEDWCGLYLEGMRAIMAVPAGCHESIGVMKASGGHENIGKF
eukprot:1152168-Pelagomonas_calceolata.AAC.2